ncbi:hypothetical protein [Rhodalgimonas zhirmunskyi]|uniref:HEPN domain-containing protein n=1 Tax=Rhodalgimonas zhirmunskyi TaxID=2964767 RepID=A0AAJ1X3M3_9RHOB|nr:hypothetical protein [Rhodoalgimonas zhirmunskyi]MDQ2093443.1 hypothetical protein [Rhodoalgimonas zhirmunskyi]
MQITPIQQHLVREMFWYAADDDYICARLSAQNGLFRHFSWNAAQCVEKLTKCIILLNGGSAKFNHSFFKPLKEKVIEPYKRCFPETLDVSAFCKVKDSMAHYASEELFDFAERIEEYGHTNGRYRQIPARVLPFDLQKLDLLVFFLRRLCAPMPLNASQRKQHILSLQEDFLFTTATQWPTVNGFTFKGKEDALRRDNTANFPELFDELPGGWASAVAAAPLETAKWTGLASTEDLSWLKSVAKI